MLALLHSLKLRVKMTLTETVTLKLRVTKAVTLKMTVKMAVTEAVTLTKHYIPPGVYQEELVNTRGLPVGKKAAFPLVNTR